MKKEFTEFLEYAARESQWHKTRKTSGSARGYPYIYAQDHGDAALWALFACGHRSAILFQHTNGRPNLVDFIYEKCEESRDFFALEFEDETQSGNTVDSMFCCREDYCKTEDRAEEIYYDDVELGKALGYPCPGEIGTTEKSCPFGVHLFYHDPAIEDTVEVEASCCHRHPSKKELENHLRKYAGPIAELGYELQIIVTDR
jgi:hypothetical protein